VREKALIDTSFVIALVNKHDRFHKQAKELAKRFEGQPLASLMEVLGALIEKYEDEHVPEIKTL